MSEFGIENCITIGQVLLDIQGNIHTNTHIQTYKDTDSFVYIIGYYKIWAES